MSMLKEHLFKLMQDPRFIGLMKDPRVQQIAMRTFRMRSRVEGAVDRHVQRIASRLHLVTQKDLRALHRRIRHLEQELRETEERLNGAADTRGAPPEAAMAEL